MRKSRCAAPPRCDANRSTFAYQSLAYKAEPALESRFVSESLKVVHWMCLTLCAWIDRERNYDVMTAIDILGSGKYERLPTMVRSEMVETKERLEDVIRMRLLCDEIVPLPMRRNVTVENGSVTIRVKDEFEIRMTLPGSTPDCVWKLDDLKILVASAPSKYTVPQHTADNVKKIREKAQTKLLTEVPDPKRAELGKPASRKNWPLVNLYEFLHSVCLQLQLKIIQHQVLSLIGTRWQNRLSVSSEELKIKIEYWKRPTTDADRRQNVIEIRIVEDAAVRRRPASAPSLSSETNPTARDVLPEIVESCAFGSCPLSPKIIRIDCFSLGADGSRTPLLDSDTGASLEVSVSPSAIDIEQLILTAAQHQANAMIRSLKTIILMSPEAKIASPAKRKHGQLSPRANEPIVEILSEEELLGAVKSAAGPLPRFYLRYHDVGILCVSVDIRTGRILLSQVGQVVQPEAPHESSGASSLQNRLLLVEERININFYDIMSSLSYFRYSTIIDKIEALAQFAGLTPVRELPIPRSESAKLHTEMSSEHTIFLRFPQYPDYYIHISVIEPNVSKESAVSYTIQIVHASLSDRPNLSRIQSVSYILHQDIFPAREKGVPIQGDDEATPAKRTKLSDNTDAPGSGANAVLWMQIDAEVLIKVESVCRKQILYSKLKSELASANIAYKYVIRGTPGLLQPEQLPVSEDRIASLEPRICIMRDNFSRYLPVATKGPSESSVSELPFGDLVIIFTKPSGASAAETDGDERLSNRKLSVLVKVRMNVRLLPSISSTLLDEDLSFDSSDNCCTLSLPDVDMAISTVCRRWKIITMISGILRQLVSRRSWLEQSGFSIDNYDLASFQLHFGDIKMKIGWEWSDTADGTSAPLSQWSLDSEGKFRLRFLNAEASETLKSFEEHFESLLNSKSIVRTLQVMGRMFPLIRWLDDMRTRNNTPDHSIRPETPLVTVRTVSANHVYVGYGAHGIDLILLTNEAFAVYDSALGDGNINALVGVGFATQHINRAVTPIPNFKSISDETANLLELDEIPEVASILPLPGGMILHSSLLLHALSFLERHLDTQATLELCRFMIAERIRTRQIESAPPAAASSTNAASDLVYTVNDLQITLHISETRVLSTRMSLKNAIPDNDPVPLSAQAVATIQNVVNAKLAALPAGTNLRPWVRFVLELTALPRVAIRDLALTMDLDDTVKASTASVGSTTSRLDWCLVVPPDAPDYAPSPGSIGLVLEPELNRFNIMFRLTDPTTQESQLVLLRSNYSTHVITQWKADGNDLTIVQAGPFLQQTKDSFPDAPSRTWEGILNTATKKEVSTAQGGPGKVSIVAKHIKQRALKDVPPWP
ncbi:uncharacterized protein BJ171DRAFT_154711 [Polychytrium aggregatum]|uniref:uncharacterized protein n=1 Tax=Polychytrium aggregatum TaxID=110093 RepID=UPI0022FE7EB0|nr:uncharacterized protein BJ171DRAFT_154711 [Polychytrium aggregatum]KAI9203200.1 hypothetical protein BJ171DRAFT_154711 [Polychytrium aggregatum]